MKCIHEPFEPCDCMISETHGLTFPKPGKKEKNRPKTKSVYVHKIETPKNRKCINCGQMTGTEVYRHPEDSTIKFLDGGGIMGGKPDDRLTSWLCSDKDCGLYYDTKPDINCEEIVRLRHDLFTAKMIIKTRILNQ